MELKINKAKAFALSAGLLFSVGVLTQLAPTSGTVQTVRAATVTPTAATRVAPATVNVTLHKGMTLTGKTQAAITADGEAHSWSGDTTDYDASKYGSVGFTAYDITNTVSSSDLTDAGIKAIDAAIKADPTGNKYTSKAQTKTSQQVISSGSSTTFSNLAASDDNGDQHVWVFLETKHSKGLVTQQADPVTVILPVTNKAGDKFQTTSNFYPKNTVTPLTFTLTKDGEDGKALAGAKFQLYSGKPGSGKAIGSAITADAKGQLKATGLTVGSYYFVELASDKVSDIDTDDAAKTYLLGADARNDTANKLGFTIGDDGIDPASLNGTYINYATPGLTKTVDDKKNSFTQGSLVPFDSTQKFPTDLAGGKGSTFMGQSFVTEPYGVYNLTDTVPAGLSWVAAEGGLKITSGDKTLVEGTDYKLTDLGTDKGWKVDFIVNNGQVSKSVAALSGQSYSIKYKMVLTADAVTDAALNNQIDLAYQNHPTNTGVQHVRHIIHKVPVYTYGAKFLKESSGVFGSGIAATPLSGAKYVIQDKATGKYFNGFKDGSDEDSVPEAQWAASADAATAGVLTSDKDGKFEIHGLTAGTYVLHEVGAPTGYELANKDQEFTVGPNTYTNDLVTLKDDQKPGLPDTGSTEGQIEYAIAAIGAMTIVVAVSYVIYKRKHTVA